MYLNTGIEALHCLLTVVTNLESVSAGPSLGQKANYLREEMYLDPCRHINVLNMLMVLKYFVIDGNLLVSPQIDIHPCSGVWGEVLAGVVYEDIN